MKRILIATDFSPHSRTVIDCVVNMIKDNISHCEIILLNTYMVKETDPQKVISLNDELKLASKRSLEHERAELQKKITNPNVSVNIASHMGSLTNVISQLVKTHTVDLVAMGKDGGRNVENVSTILRQIGCPLLVTYLASA
jgi:nucleotide-binding universal stress UspA family protein